MDDAQPDGGQWAELPARLDEVTDSLTGLYEALDGREELDVVLSRLVQTAVRAVPDATAASVTMVTETGTRTAASTDDGLSALEDQQRSHGHGPSQESTQLRRPVRAGTGEQDRNRWPEFTTAASRAGVAAYLSAPVFVHEPAQSGGSASDDATVLGWLNLYSDSPTGFDPFDEALLRLLTTSVSAAVRAARREDRSRELVDNLQRALTSRTEIDEAKGVLMAVHGVDADAAFSRLVTESQDTNRKLATVARQLLESVQER